MKVKEVDLTANFSWSPAPLDKTYLATGTAAQQLDASFSTASALEIYSLDLAESGHGMTKAAACPVEHRYQRLAWGDCGMGKGGARQAGVIAGGLDQGGMALYDASKLLSGADAQSCFFNSTKHTGSVAALDFNPFQSNLLATGAADSEIYIWDLNKLAGPETAPMSPGAKSQPPDEVRDLAWNRQVQHILATTFASRCVVWDLRKNDPIIKVSDSTSRMRTKAVAWHPDVATQLCLASEDDHTPVIQIWDLRLASSPIRTLEGHQRGVLSVAWCQQDSDLLLSCGKDNRILCWNPNSGEVQCELASSSSWSFDVSWCPRNPAVVASASFDGHVSVYSLMGGQQQPQPTTSIADSFPGMEAMQPVAAAATPQASVQLKQPPKWLRRPCGASFGFGGQLVAFEALPQQPAAQGHPAAQPASKVSVLKVVTEPEFVERSMRLETAIQNQNLPEFAGEKVCTTKDEKELWNFIFSTYESQDVNKSARTSYQELLGFVPQETSTSVAASTGVADPNPEHGVTNEVAGLNLNDDSVDEFGAIAAATEKQNEVEQKSQERFDVNTDDSQGGNLTKTLQAGNLEHAVELCLALDRPADALVLAGKAGPDVLERTTRKYLASRSDAPASEHINAVALDEWRSFVRRVSTKCWRDALVSVVTYASHDEFRSICGELGDRVLGDGNGHGAMICYVCAGDVDKFVNCWMGMHKNKTGPRALQDLVEVSMSLKHAVEHLYGAEAAALQPGGPLAAKLTEYAGLLAAQGELSAALAYFGSGEEQDEGVIALKNRLSGALGRSAASAAPAANRTRGASTSSTGRFSQASRRRSSTQQPSFGSSMNSNYPAPPQPTAAAPSFHNPYNNQPTSSYMEPAPTSYMTPAPPAMTPAAPPTSFMTPAPAPTSSYMTPASSAAQPQYDYAPPPQAAQPAHLPPTSSGPGWNDPPPMALTSKPKAPVTASTTSALGSAPITQPLAGGAPTDAMAPPPMMGGVGDPGYGGYGSPPQSMFDPNANTGYGAAAPPPMQQQQPMNFMTPGAVPQQQHQAPPANASYQGPPANFMQPAAPAAAAPAPAPQPPAPVQKGPIPSEHLVLQEVFEALRTKCMQAANHPQTRRKLDDVGKKLEILYDRLRDNSLPPPTLAGLHTIKDYTSSRQYPEALATVNTLVGSGSFSILAEFLPGVKVLLQVAAQQGIYL